MLPRRYNQEELNWLFISLEIKDLEIEELRQEIMDLEIELEEELER